MWSLALGYDRAVVVAVDNKPTNAREMPSKTHPLAAVCKQLEHHVQRCRLRLSGRASWLAQRRHESTVGIQGWTALNACGDGGRALTDKKIFAHTHTSTQWTHHTSPHAR